ncbi:hypothetical protein F0562_034141 [Nyssa sinensis]|uniref:Uncharacterized protein n=1 Tax=Nyssa sinensis TaxID=561372 RepID=A0A5J5AHR7_9ASTE|nr:hypothetical protein F0562_034141 [Nyssa sinensis]
MSYAGANKKLCEITVKTHAGPTPTPPAVLKRYDFSALVTSDALAVVYCSNQEGPQQAPFDARQPGPHSAKLANPTTPSSHSAQQLTAPGPLGQQTSPTNPAQQLAAHQKGSTSSGHSLEGLDLMPPDVLHPPTDHIIATNNT